MSLSLVGSETPLPLSDVFSDITFTELLQVLPLSEDFADSLDYSKMATASGVSLSTSISILQGV